MPQRKCRINEAEPVTFTEWALPSSKRPERHHLLQALVFKVQVRVWLGPQLHCQDQMRKDTENERTSKMEPPLGPDQSCFCYRGPVLNNPVGISTVLDTVRDPVSRTGFPCSVLKCCVATSNSSGFSGSRFSFDPFVVFKVEWNIPRVRILWKPDCM